MKPKIVRLEIVDTDVEFKTPLLDAYLLVNPDREKLAELKHMIEHRFDTDGLTDEEIEAKQNFCDDIWGNIERFINENFIVLHLDEIYDIEY
jgi:hypothetical protein